MKAHLNTWLVRRYKQDYDSGLTLLECLVAIAVIALTSATIAPVILFSVATRIQSQKAEQALQLAQLEIDSIRIEVERGGDYGVFLNAYPKTSETEEDIKDSEPPDTFAPNLTSSSLTVAKEVNVDDDAEPEFAVQVFRTEGFPLASSTPTAFKVGVRVYDYRATNSNLSTGLERDAASLSFTSGEGQRGLRPLAVLYADIIQSDKDTSLCDYRQYINPDSSSITGIDCG